ncbi:MAG: PLDc N-terminal domain-containing protein, partial [Candidatus Acidiferrales bacterium]
MTTALDTQSTFKSELKIIPPAGWLAAGFFLLCWFAVVMPFILGTVQPTAALGGLLTFAGVILSIWVLMVFYVNADSGRRQMNRLLWTLLVIFIPNAIGFIIYFVIRKPIARPCPKCQAPVRPEFVFCP